MPPKIQKLLVQSPDVAKTLSWNKEQSIFLHGKLHSSSQGDEPNIQAALIQAAKTFSIPLSAECVYTLFSKIFDETNEEHSRCCFAEIRRANPPALWDQKLDPDLTILRKPVSRTQLYNVRKEISDMAITEYSRLTDEMKMAVLKTILITFHSSISQKLWKNYFKVVVERLGAGAVNAFQNALVESLIDKVFFLFALQILTTLKVCLTEH